jgi:hypothetical protein
MNKEKKSLGKGITNLNKIFPLWKVILWKSYTKQFHCYLFIMLWVSRMIFQSYLIWFVEKSWKVRDTVLIMMQMKKKRQRWCILPALGSKVLLTPRTKVQINPSEDLMTSEQSQSQPLTCKKGLNINQTAPSSLLSHSFLQDSWD